MNSQQTLVTIAIRYCIDQYSYWVQRYQLERTGADSPYTYSDSDYNLFPRYHTLNAIRLGLLEIVSREFPSFEMCKSSILEIGNHFETDFVNSPKNEIERQAILDERRKFERQIEEIEEDELLFVSRYQIEESFRRMNPLPFGKS